MITAEAITPKHQATLVDRKTLSLTGIRAVLAYSEEEAVFETPFGQLAVRGKDLRMVQSDSTAGTVTLTGEVAEFVYLVRRKRLQEWFSWHDPSSM